MDKAEAERNRKKVYAKAKHARDSLLAAQHTIPALVTDLNEIMEAAAPPETEKETEPDA
jgi:hypothetical protein